MAASGEGTRRMKVDRRQIGLEIRYRKHTQSRAHRALNNAVSAGTINRPAECSLCGSQHDRINAHHPAYEKPLTVVWVCSTCHKRIHRWRDRWEDAPNSLHLCVPEIVGSYSETTHIFKLTAALLKMKYIEHGRLAMALRNGDKWAVEVWDRAKKQHEYRLCCQEDKP